MDTSHPVRGTTLPELLVAMLVFAILAAMAAVPVRRAADAYAVRAAADTIIAGFARTRSAAWSAGGARLILDVPGGRYRIETVDGRLVSGPVDVGVGGRVRVGVDAAADSIEFRYDALGIGRLASRTIRLSRGTAEARLTVSAYGRVRRW